MRWWLSRVVRGLSLVALFLLAIWTASNSPWVDAAPQPVAPALLLRPVLLAPERNAFFNLQALDAPPGADTHALGLRVIHGHPLPDEGRLAWPDGELWRCQSGKLNCVEAWRTQADTLRGLMAPLGALGERCERAARAEGIEEVLPERMREGPLAGLPYAELPMPRGAGLAGCMRWFGAQAVLAPTPQQAFERFARADRLGRASLDGSRSLLTMTLVLAALQRNWLLAADYAAAEPRADRAELLALLQPLAPEVLSPRAWIPFEAHLARELMRDATGYGCGGARTESDGAIKVGLCRWLIGGLPEQSLQDVDARWKARLADLPATGPAACDALTSARWRDTTRPWPSWRNTLPRWVLDTPQAHYGRYAARQLDLELLRQTLRAQLLGESAPGAVTLTRDGGAQRFAACRARLYPGDAGATLRLPLL
jgi:hypothetical protein